ncbi:MAG TPA: universal stress protein [Longimicrobiales bacterium]|nr:universal stress protein [Longimicrobiales bacterium]
MSNVIMVPLDGSEFAERALDVAGWLAARMSASLHLVQVHVPVTPIPVVQAEPIYDPRLDAIVREQEEEYLRSKADRCSERSGVPARGELLDGPVVDTLAEYARDVGAMLVVMTTHGRGGLSRLWLGSVADGLIRTIPVPVLLLRPDEGGAGVPAPDAMFRHVLIPLDGSALSERVIEPALRIGSLNDARYTLLQTVSPLFPAGEPGVPEHLRDAAANLQYRREAAEAYLNDVAERMRARGVEVTTAVETSVRPADTILEFASAHGVDGIAMSSRGRGGWSRIALGSVSDKVIRSTHLPVLVQPPGPERDAAEDGSGTA